MGLDELLRLVSPHKSTREKARDLILELKESPKRKKELLRELGWSEYQFKSLVRMLKRMGLIYSKRTQEGTIYYLSYEGFAMWLKGLRDTVYNLVKRNRI